MASRSPVNAQQQQGTKRNMMGAFAPGPGESSTASSFSNSSSMMIDGADPETVRLLFEDIKAKLDKKLEVLETSLMTAQQKITNEYSMQMVKLPKSVKQMTIRDFNKNHGCNLLEILRRSDGVVVSTSSLKRSLPPVAETPAPRSRTQQQVPGSILRTVKRGEQVL
jgi:hypothetical protein